MGAKYEGDEKAIEELQGLSAEAKKYLSHHLRNSLATILFGAEKGEFIKIKRAAWHIEEDLKKIGC